MKKRWLALGFAAVLAVLSAGIFQAEETEVTEGEQVVNPNPIDKEDKDIFIGWIK